MPIEEGRVRSRGGGGAAIEIGDSDSDSDSDSSSDGKGRRRPLVPSKLPGYLSDAFADLYGEDGLAVLGRGMGMLGLLASFVRFYGDPGPDGHAALVREEERDRVMSEGATAGATAGTTATTTPPLVFVLGLRESERRALRSTLDDWGTPSRLLPTEITNESGQGKDREAMYRRGGVFLITSRILIVDLLTGIADPVDIEGLLVAHAEAVTEQSTEAFIVRIYRTQKQWGGAAAGKGPRRSALSPTPHGFVKAFTDNPDSLVAGFAKVDKILKALMVRGLYLYPRFHDAVSSELELCPPYVDELRQGLTPAMVEIQNAIAAAVQACIRELKRSTSLIEWAESDLTVENCVTTAFDMSISRQLEHDWHKLGPQTKQLVNDLRTLRNLFQYLIHYDCISFYKLLMSIKTASAGARHPSMWILSDTGDVIFRRARERIYRIEQDRPSKKVPRPVARLRPVLEGNPKWSLLEQVVWEIRNDWPVRMRHRSASVGGSREGTQDECGGARVLVMVKDDRTLDSVRTFLTEGKDRIMTLRWVRYLEQVNDRSRAVAKSAGGSSAISEESRLLLEEEGRARNFLFGHGASRLDTKRRQSAFLPDWKRKKRKIASERGRGERTMQADDLERRAVLDEAIEETEQDLAGEGVDPYQVDSIRQASTGSPQCSSDSSSDEEDELPYKVGMLEDLRIVFRTYSSVERDGAQILLSGLKPTYVVLYDADPSFIRSLEIYASTSRSFFSSAKSAPLSQHDRLRVFFMLFHSSSEEKNFLKALDREKKAFERLIFHKKSMPLPLNTLTGTTQEMQMARGGIGGSYAGGKLPLSIDTRTGRGKQGLGKERREIAVDVREFRSALPSILHQGGMRLAPVTLTVGDFVLSNVHCVERKSISDLFGSFASGRLYTQAEAMSKHYKCPILLIEFDPSKSFSLQNSREVGSDIRTDGVCSKMSLLILHFPRLRLLWSRSPHETVKVFKALKINHNEPDVDRAIDVGSNESLDSLLGSNTKGSEHDDDDENEINEAARDMLLRLPGVTINNARKIMKECDSIAELADMPRDDLKKLVGPLTGQKLFTFFRKSM